MARPDLFVHAQYIQIRHNSVTTRQLQDPVNALRNQIAGQREQEERDGRKEKPVQIVDFLACMTSNDR